MPGSALLGSEGAGFDLLSEWLGASRLTVAAFSVGRARRVLELAAGWAATRKQFGRPVGQFQGVGFSLADMATELEAADLLTLRAAWRLTQHQMSDTDAAMAKLYASEMLGRAHRPGSADLRRHGPDERLADRAVLARRAGRADLGRDQRDPAAHHLAIDAARKGCLT